MVLHPGNASSVATQDQEELEVNIEELIYSVTLACAYLLLALVSSFQLGKIIFNRHNLASFQVLFVILSFLWTTNRAVFFCINVEYTPRSLFAMLWIADDLELTTYVLVAVFYIHWIKHEDARGPSPSAMTRKIRCLVTLVYAALVFCIFTKTIVMIAWCNGASCTWATDGEDSLYEHMFDTLLTFGYVGLFLSFSWIFVMVQLRLHKQRNAGEGRVREQLSRHGIHDNTMVGRKLMMIFWVIFTTQAIYACVRQAGYWNIEIGVDDDNHKKFGFPVFLSLILWEIVPTSLVLWVFRSIPSTNAAGCTFWSKRRQDYHPDYSSDIRTQPRPQRSKRRSHRRGRASKDSELSVSQYQQVYSSTSQVWSSSLRYSPPVLNNQAAQCLEESPWSSSTVLVQPRKEKRFKSQNLAPESITPSQLKVPDASKPETGAKEVNSTME